MVHGHDLHFSHLLLTTLCDTVRGSPNHLAGSNHTCRHKFRTCVLCMFSDCMGFGGKYALCTVRQVAIRASLKEVKITEHQRLIRLLNKQQVLPSFFFFFCLVAPVVHIYSARLTLTLQTKFANEILKRDSKSKAQVSFYSSCKRSTALLMEVLRCLVMERRIRCSFAQRVHHISYKKRKNC